MKSLRGYALLSLIALGATLALLPACKSEPGEDSKPCQALIACVKNVDAAATKQVSDGYGAGGTCWDSFDYYSCEWSCWDQLRGYGDANPYEERCTPIEPEGGLREE